jgi:guanyl-specific ribonuclease Sa
MEAHMNFGNTARRDGRGWQATPIGIALLMTVFIAVCLTVLSVGAYVTAKEDSRRAQRHAARQTAYQNAANKAERVCEQLDRGEAPAVAGASWQAEAQEITVKIKTGGTFKAGVSAAGGRHRITWTQVMPEQDSGAEDEQTVSGL